jgi:hypothetical protein
MAGGKTMSQDTYIIASLLLQNKEMLDALKGIRDLAALPLDLDPFNALEQIKRIANRAVNRTYEMRKAMEEKQ